MARLKYYNEETGQWEYADKVTVSGGNEGSSEQVQADWSENDETSKAHVKGRTHYAEGDFWTIEWDGNTENIETSVTATVTGDLEENVTYHVPTYYLVSDRVPTDEEILASYMGVVMVDYETTDIEAQELPISQAEEYGLVTRFDGATLIAYVAVVYQENAQINQTEEGITISMTFPKKGVYFGVIQTETDYTGAYLLRKPLIGKKLDKEFLPDDLVGRRTSSALAKFADVFNDHTMNRAVGHYSHAEGYQTTAKYDYAHSEGEGTTASGQASHAEGIGSEASGVSGHAEGEETSAAGGASHAEGYQTLARGEWSHAEGKETRALNDASHAEGYTTWAFHNGAHAEGLSSVAYGSSSHAEGVGNTWVEAMYVRCTANSPVVTLYDTSKFDAELMAPGCYLRTDYDIAVITEVNASTATLTLDHSIKEYDGTEWVWFSMTGIASGSASHAEGASRANGHYSHSEGYKTAACGRNQHVQGRNNIPDYEDKYAHIVGNGTDGPYMSSPATKSNAHTIDWNGLGWFSGGLKVGGSGQDDANASEVLTKSTGYTKEEVDALIAALRAELTS